MPRRIVLELASPLLPATRRPCPSVVTCAQCREQVLEADLIGDEEECTLRRSPHGYGAAMRKRMLQSKALPAVGISVLPYLRSAPDRTPRLH